MIVGRDFNILSVRAIFIDQNTFCSKAHDLFPEETFDGESDG